MYIYQIDGEWWVIGHDGPAAGPFETEREAERWLLGCPASTLTRPQNNSQKRSRAMSGGAGSAEE